MKKLFSSYLILLFLSMTVLAQAKEMNNPLTDFRVPTQYLPISKSLSNNTEIFSFIDRTSIRLHPYNKNIRMFIEIVNNNPALALSENDPKTSYRSIVNHYYANCDKQELVKGAIRMHANYFGEGRQHSYNDEPRRWEYIDQNSSIRNLFIIACSLPLHSITATN